MAGLRLLGRALSRDELFDDARERDEGGGDCRFGPPARAGLGLLDPVDADVDRVPALELVREPVNFFPDVREVRAEGFEAMLGFCWPVLQRVHGSGLLIAVNR